MNIIIAGAGEVGGHAADVLSTAGHNVTVIDLDAARLESLNDSHDVRVLQGHCAHFDVLKEARVEHCDLMIAATRADEVNLLTAFMAKAAGAGKTIVRVHHTANFSLAGTPFAQKLGVDELICPEHAASLVIARSIRNPGLIALEEFGRGQLLMQRIPVTKGAAAIGKQLSDFVMSPGTRLVTVERGDLVSLANANTVILNGDVVTLVGEQKAFDSAKKLFNKDTKEKRQYVAILGETATAVWLCRALKSRVFSVRLFARNHDRAVELSNKLPHVTVLEGDPTDLAVFSEERLETLDAFVAVTDDDEQNILACAQAKTLGVKSVIAVVQRSKYLHLFGHVGIDHAFSPRQVAVNAIRHLIEDDRVRSIATIAAGVAEVYEVRSTSRSRILETDLRNVKLPTNSIIAAIRRGEQVFVPSADHRIEEGDTVLVVGSHGIADQLRAIFGAS